MPNLDKNTAIRILCEEINLQNIALLPSIHGSVDNRKRWDGTIKPADFETVKIKNNWRDIVRNYLNAPTTFGAFGFEVGTDNGNDEISSVSIRYVLTSASNNWQPLYKNSIERSFRTALDDERRFRKEVQNKYKSLVKGVVKWFNEDQQKLDIKRYKAPTNGKYDWAERQVAGYIIENVGRTRVCMEHFVQLCEANGIGGNSNRLRELVEELASELKKNLLVNPMHDGIYEENR